MPEATTIALSCNNCGARLQITDEIDRLACLHCGTQQIVRRGGGIISLQPLVQGIERVQHGTDRTAAELAIARLTTEIQQAGREIEEWRELPLDNVSPPETVEQLLPWASGIALFSGFLLLAIDPSLLCVGVLLSPVLLFLYLHTRANRLGKARKIVEEQAKLWIDDIVKLRADLERNRRIVST